LGDLAVLEKLLRVGDASPLLVTGTLAGGAGGLCSTGVSDQTIGSTRYWHLPFVKDGINYASSQGRDVVSYNFTGCIMATFNVGGDRRVCHVSTGDGQDCKAAWDAVKAGATNVFEFKPSDFIETGGGSFLGCYGLITGDLQTLSITVTGDKAGGSPKIAAITKGRLLR
jgi:hypothetical protein